MASQSHLLEVSHGQASCTTDVQVGERFTFEGLNVALIDTPGFDDTERSDADILQSIIIFGCPVSLLRTLARNYCKPDLKQSPKP
jgi:hypothetical protein